MSSTVPSHDEAAVTVDTATIDLITGIGADVDPERSPAREQIVWSEADTGLWAANYNGYYGGVVDQHGDHYFVSDTFGQYVGDYRSLDEAKDRLADRLLLLLPNAHRPLR